MTPAEALDALQAVREALDIPNAATMGGEQTRAQILGYRVVDAVAALRAVLDDGAEPAWCTAYLRERLAEHPAEGYKTWAEAVAELEAAKEAQR